MPQFAVGTKVTVKADGHKGRPPLSGFYDHNCGREGVVIERQFGRGPNPADGASRVWVDFGDVIDCGYPENLETPAATFAVGDRVKVVTTVKRGPLNGLDFGRLHSTGIVVNSDEWGYKIHPSDREDRVYVRFGDGVDCGYPEELEKVVTVPSTFTPGDVVTLKSGGPKMTVERVTEGDVETTWHLATGEATGAAYAPEVLCKE